MSLHSKAGSFFSLSRRKYHFACLCCCSLLIWVKAKGTIAPFLNVAYPYVTLSFLKATFAFLNVNLSSLSGLGGWFYSNFVTPTKLPLSFCTPHDLMLSVPACRKHDVVYIYKVTNGCSYFAIANMCFRIRSIAHSTVACRERLIFPFEYTFRSLLTIATYAIRQDVLRQNSFRIVNQSE